MKAKLEIYRANNELLARAQAYQQEFNAILMHNLTELMENKSEQTNSVGEKHIPEKETNK